MATTQIRGRFAPSPSGRMHLGNIYSAIISYLSAKSKNGEWIVRIEDLDRQRCKRQYADLLLSDLDWLGLYSDAPIIYQSERDTIYTEALQKLEQQKLTYDCFCRRADILSAQAPHETDGRVVYSGKCRNLSQAELNILRTERKPATRIIVPDENIEFIDGHYGKQECNLAKHCGDFIVRRADGNFAYQLAVVVDDALQEITEIVRGRDLLTSTHQQIYLYNKLGHKTPQFAHIPLLVSENGQRLAKRDKGTDMAYLRSHFTPEDIIGQILHIANITDKNQAISLSEAIEIFSWECIPKDDIKI